MNPFAQLHQHCVLHTREKVHSHHIVAEELSDHFLRWHGQRVDTKLCKLDTANISLYSLKYGEEVSIFPEVYDQFSLVHFSLKGQISVEADQHASNVGESRALISSPKHSIKLHWSNDSEQLILRLPHALTRVAAQELGRPSLHGDLTRTPGLLLREDVSELWYSQLCSFVALDTAKTRLPSLEPWVAHVEQGIAKFLLLQLAHGAGQTDRRVRAGYDRRRQRIERLYNFAEANLDKPVRLTAMAKAVALSERQLNALCHNEFGQSPLAWLRGLRLDAVRKELLSEHCTDLCDLAMRFGFFHLGRFAGFYRERFGELPNQTRKSAIAG